MTYSRADLLAEAARRGPTARRLLSIILDAIDAQRPSVAAQAQSDADELPRKAG